MPRLFFFFLKEKGPRPRLHCITKKPTSLIQRLVPRSPTRGKQGKEIARECLKIEFLANLLHSRFQDGQFPGRRNHATLACCSASSWRCRQFDCFCFFSGLLLRDQHPVSSGEAGLSTVTPLMFALFGLLGEAARRGWFCSSDEVSGRPSRSLGEAGSVEACL